jgi:hypothetical protein
VRLIEQPCPQCGGPPVPATETADVRFCDNGIALVVAGRTVMHLAGWKALTLAGGLTLLAARDGIFVFDRDSAGMAGHEWAGAGTRADGADAA